MVPRLAILPTVLFLAACNDDLTTEPKHTALPTTPSAAVYPATITTQFHDASHTTVTEVPSGTPLHSRAVVVGMGPPPTGVITFHWYNEGSCDGTAWEVAQPVPLDGAGVAHDQLFGMLAEGRIYAVRAVYSGDANYAPAVAPCATINASGRLIPTIALQMHGFAHQLYTEVPELYSVHPNITVTGSGATPAGGVALETFVGASCTGIPLVAGSPLLLNASGVLDNFGAGFGWPAGTYAYQAIYWGDANYAMLRGPCVSFTTVPKMFTNPMLEIHDGNHQVVTSIGTSTAIHASVTMQITEPMPSGQIMVKRFAGASCQGTFVAMTGTLIDGNMHFSLGQTLPAGPHSFQASYAGSATHIGSTGPCLPITVGQGKLPSTTVTAVHNPAHQPTATATFTVPIHGKATVTGSGQVPTGTVIMRRFQNATCTGTAWNEWPAQPLDASGTMDNGNNNFSGGATGEPWSFQATYSGDANYEPSIGTCVVFTRVAGLPVTLTSEIHDANHQPVTSVPASATPHAKVALTWSGPALTGNVLVDFFENGFCGGASKAWVSVAAVNESGVYDLTTLLGTSGGSPGSQYSFKAAYPGDATYDPAIGACMPYTITADPAPEPTGVKLGSIGYWRNWRNRYTASQLQQLIDVVKTSYAPVFNKDGIAGNADDLTWAKTDAIYLFPKKPSTGQQVLAHYTSLAFDLALTQIAQQAGLVKPNDSICGGASLDVSGIAGAAALLGTSSPTLAQVMTFVTQQWSGSLAGTKIDWTFNLTPSELEVMLQVLSKVNNGTIVVSTGC